ncbi:hypothetical protein MTX20_18045 [Bradyrhizobium sp. ISRA435]|nr:hypothetical protein MTX20_18045 [Bradyrhizobium sp. ISRA435]
MACDLVRRRRVDIVADVELAAADLRQHVVAHAMAQEHLGPLRRGGEGAHERSEPGEFGIEDSADAERSALGLLQRVRRRLEVGGRSHGLVRQGQQRDAGFRQGEAARGAVEKLQAGAFLQRLQLQADGRLGQLQHRRRARHGAFTGNSDEAAQGLGAGELAHLAGL